MKNLPEHNYRLYVGNEISHYETFSEAKVAAHSYQPDKVELRIEILIDLEPGEADFWAYEYESNQWAPS